MPIHYSLYKNPLPAAADSYAARIHSNESAELEDIVQRILEQGTTVTKPDVLAVLENAIDAVDSMLLEGYRVNLGGLCELFPRLKGKFDSITDHYDPARHKLDVGANPGRRIRNTVRSSGSLVKDETILPHPSVLSFHDVTTNTYNDQAIPGGVAAIAGHRLAYDAAQPDEGIFFITGGTEERVVNIQKNKPSELVFQIPSSLTANTYNLEVRARFGSTTSELRSGRLDGTITVS